MVSEVQERWVSMNQARALMILTRCKEDHDRYKPFLLQHLAPRSIHVGIHPRHPFILQTPDSPGVRVRIWGSGEKQGLALARLPRGVASRPKNQGLVRSYWFTSSRAGQQSLPEILRAV